MGDDCQALVRKGVTFKNSIWMVGTRLKELLSRLTNRQITQSDRKRPLNRVEQSTTPVLCKKSIQAFNDSNRLPFGYEFTYKLTKLWTISSWNRFSKSQNGRLTSRRTGNRHAEIAPTGVGEADEAQQTMISLIEMKGRCCLESENNH